MTARLSATTHNFALAMLVFLLLPVSAMAQDAEEAIRAQTERWFAAWSPGAEPLDWDLMREVFMPGDDAILVVDDFGTEIVTVRSVDEYIETWRPVLAEGYAFWKIRPIGDIVVRVGPGFAYSSFLWEANGRTRDGRTLRPRQRGTHVWQQDEAGEWRIIHEHLTIADDGVAEEDLSATIRQRIIDWGNAWVLGDAAENFDIRATAAPFYADDLLAFDTSDEAGKTVIRGIEEFNATWEPFVRQWDEWRFIVQPDTIDVRVMDNDTAWATLFIDNYGVAQDGSEFFGPAQGTLIWERRDGEWLIVHEHISLPRKDPAE